MTTHKTEWEQHRELLERYEAETGFVITTTALDDAITGLIRFSPIRIPGPDVSLIRSAASQAVAFLDTYGFRLIDEKACDDLMHAAHNAGGPLATAYRYMKTGVEAVNATIEAHNQWVAKEPCRFSDIVEGYLDTRT